MSIFVLVHGAWHGGWCWDPLVPFLHAAGHHVLAPTLKGLGDRADELDTTVTPDVHAREIAALIVTQSEPVILVGHSYGGLIITAAAEQAPEQVKHLCYLDAFVPQLSGVSPLSQVDPERVARFRAEAIRGNLAVKPDAFDRWTDDPEIRELLERKCTPHPIRCITDGVTLNGRALLIANRTFILATRNTGSAFWAEYDRCVAQGGWRLKQIPTKHNAMQEAPELLSRTLEEAASFDPRSNGNHAT